MSLVEALQLANLCGLGAAAGWLIKFVIRVEARLAVIEANQGRASHEQA